MKIAMMTNNYKPFVGGVPISIELLAKGLIAAGHEVTVFAPAAATVPAGSGLTVCDGVPVLRYASLPYCFLGGAACPNPFDPRIEEEFRRCRYDIIHVHHPMLIGRTAVRLSRRYRVPLVFTYHTRYDQYLLNAGVFRCLDRVSRNACGAASRAIPQAANAAADLATGTATSLMVNTTAALAANTAALATSSAASLAAGEAMAASSLRADLARQFLRFTQEEMVPLYLRLFLQNCHQVFAPTAGMKEYLTGVCRFDPARVAVLPTGIEDSCFDADPAAAAETRARLLGETPKAPLFLTVSRLSHEKNISFLLRSAALFRDRYRRPFRLAVAGDGPDRKEYEALCRKLHLEQEVIFTGSIPHGELAPYYAAADAFLFASTTETQGIVLLEAFAGGSPVIAVDASGVRDLVRDGQNGLLCAEDENAFAQKMNLYCEDWALQERLRRRALAAAGDFREESVVKKAIRIYNKTIAAYSAPLWQTAERIILS